MALSFRRDVRHQARKLSTAIACACVLTLCLGIASIAEASAYSTIVNNGSPDNRVDIVFLGDGYTQADHNAGTYNNHVNAYLNYMFTPDPLSDPFGRYANFFNVHKIDVVSQQSGADEPPNNIYVNTALDASYWWDGSTERLLYISNAKANNEVATSLDGTGITADLRMVTVNSTKYGGGGGTYAVYAGGNSSAQDVALHELGHSFSDLADEYTTGGNGHYTGPEPSEINVTINASGAKWAHWLGFDDPRGSILDIGVFEGARYHTSGIYRPSQDSKMRTLNDPFNAVSREKIILDIYAQVDPLDDWRQTPGDWIAFDSELWVDVVDPAVISVEWLVDGVPVTGATGETFRLGDYGFAPGYYDVTARVYDTVLEHVGDGSLFDLVRKDLHLLEQSVSWVVDILKIGDATYDGRVNDDDIAVVANNWNAVGTDWTGGDFNNDGVTDSLDLYLLSQNWIDTSGGSTGGGGIPEPSSLALLSVGAIAMVRRR